MLKAHCVWEPRSRLREKLGLLLHRTKRKEDLEKRQDALLVRQKTMHETQGGVTEIVEPGSTKTVTLPAPKRKVRDSSIQVYTHTHTHEHLYGSEESQLARRTASKTDVVNSLLALTP
jgi:hypothetical protein